MDGVVVWIVGQAYCGSSLLNLLLDTLPGVRGVGEGWQAYRAGPAGGPCARCRSTVGECELYRRYDGGPFYRFNFAHYGCRALVDSSKHSEWLLEKPWEPGYDHRAIVLSKAPHEAAWSLREHCRWDWWDRDKRHRSVDACFETYCAEYGLHLERLHRSGRFADEAIRAVTYRDVAERPAAVLEDLGRWIGCPQSGARDGPALFDTDTHVLGGNPAVIAEIAGDDSLLPASRDAYLGGKYAERRRDIRPDEAWRADTEFRRECEEAYRRWSEPLSRHLPRLGHGSVARMEAQLASGGTSSRAMLHER